MRSYCKILMTLLRKYEKLRMLVWVKTMADTIMATFIGPECIISPSSSPALDLTAYKGNIRCGGNCLDHCTICQPMCDNSLWPASPNINATAWETLLPVASSRCHGSAPQSGEDQAAIRRRWGIVALSWMSWRWGWRNKKTSYSTKSSMYFSALIFV